MFEAGREWGCESADAGAWIALCDLGVEPYRRAPRTVGTWRNLAASVLASEHGAWLDHIGHTSVGEDGVRVHPRGTGPRDDCDRQCPGMEPARAAARGYAGGYET